MINNKNLNLTSKSLFLFIMSFHNSNLSSMEVVSPFMNCINQCRNKMKKLRKKIYKNLKAKQNASPSLKKKISTKDLISTLRSPKIPSFVSSALCDLSSQDALQDITNIIVTDSFDFDKLRHYADEQEQEVEEIIQTMRE